jgi:Disulphide bond corrector protein DsbC
MDDAIRMMKTRRASAGFVIVALGLCAAAASAQFVSNAPRSQSAEKTEAVQFLYPEQLILPVGKASPVALHFRVAHGLHINSHTPSEDFLIPTVFSIPDGASVRLESANYPQGTNITLAADPSTRLNVYTGEFAIQARLIAAPGDHLVKGKLRYQACDQTQCMPPKTITVAIDVIGK